MPCCASCPQVVNASSLQALTGRELTAQEISRLNQQVRQAGAQHNTAQRSMAQPFNQEVI